MHQLKQFQDYVINTKKEEEWNFVHPTIITAKHNMYRKSKTRQRRHNYSMYVNQNLVLLPKLSGHHEMIYQ